MIDVHIIERDKPFAEWLATALASIPTDICTIHHFKAEGNPIWKNRIKGYSLGEHEYVSFVDDDDYVHEGAFEACLDWLEIHPDCDAVGTFEEMLLPSGEIKVLDIDKCLSMDFASSKGYWLMLHHVVVFRRTSLVPFLRFMQGEIHSEHVLKLAMFNAGLKAKMLPIIGYTWRRHSSSYSVDHLNRGV